MKPRFAAFLPHGLVLGSAFALAACGGSESSRHVVATDAGVDSGKGNAGGASGTGGKNGTGGKSGTGGVSATGGKAGTGGSGAGGSGGVLTDAAAPDASADGAVPGDASSGSAPDGAPDGALPVIPIPTGTYAVGATWGPVASGQYPGGLWGGQSLTFDGSGAMSGLTNASFGFTLTGAPEEIGADGIVAWGRWNTGTTTMGGGTNPVTALNYVAGVQAPDPAALASSYTAFASTAPTALSGATLLVGSSNRVTGTVTVSSGTVTFTLDGISVGGHTFAITGSSGFYATTGFLSGGTVTSATGCTSSCDGNVTNAGLAQGWFIGTTGQRAALNYGFTSDVGNVSGAVVLE